MNYKSMTIAELRSALTEVQNLETLIMSELANKMKFIAPVNKQAHGKLTTPSKQVPYQTDPLYKIATRHREERSGE